METMTMTRRILSAVLILALVAGIASAQLTQRATATDDRTFPDGLEGERFRRLIEAISTRNLTLASTFYSDDLAEEFRERLPEDSFLELYQRVASTSGGLDFYGVRTYDPPRPGVTTVIAEGRNYGAWWAIAFFYGDDPDRGLTDIKITRARTPVDVAATPVTVDEFVAEVSGMMDRVCEQGLFSGSVLVAAGNDVVLQHACGDVDPDPDSDPETHTLVDVGTRFNIGSLNKMFTAVAVAQLVEHGKLSYDDTLSEFLDESWLPAGVADRVTIHQLLSHTSGLGDFLEAAAGDTSREQFRALDDYREFVAADSLRFEPGTDWLFSSTGYMLLGAVIESVTGEDYFDHMQKYLFGPAGMADTGWSEDVRGGPAGGGFSTARDLHRFTMALASGDLLPGEMLERMWTPQRGGDGAYGYGFTLRTTPKGFVVGHDGAFPGVEAYYDIYVQTGHTVVVLTNLEGAAWPVNERISELMERLE